MSFEGFRLIIPKIALESVYHNWLFLVSSWVVAGTYFASCQNLDLLMFFMCFYETLSVNKGAKMIINTAHRTQFETPGDTRSPDGRLWVSASISRRKAWFKNFFFLFAAFADALALFAMCIIVGTVYHLAAFGESPVFENLYQVGGLIGLLFILPNIARYEYQFTNYLTSRGHTKRLFLLWNLVFLSTAALGFLTKTSTHFSRLTILLFYIFGFMTILLVRSTIVHMVRASSKQGNISVRRAFLVGTPDELKSFGERYQPWNLGLEITGMATLSGEMDATGSQIDTEIELDIERAVATARTLDIDDVFILVPWSKDGLINHCVQAFLNLPLAVHLGPERIFDNFDDIRISKIGPIASLNLVRRPLSALEQLQKRLLDIILSIVGIITLFPLFGIIALLIKLDSKGPVFFKQKRFGFNQQQFAIYKFRSMTTADNGETIIQASREDARVTRIGWWLRRLSFDELPQLWNVLLGHMSLVGPRPHALAHDREFEQKISLYARRHNVKPGITGWAQVNGFRGETETDSKMQGRVTYDLYYIDNWSIWMDLKILVLTVISQKSRSNSY